MSSKLTSKTESKERGREGGGMKRERKRFRWTLPVVIVFYRGVCEIQVGGVSVRGFNMGHSFAAEISKRFSFCSSCFYLLILFDPMVHPI